MKEPIRFVIAVILVISIVAGCGAAARDLAKMSEGEKTGVFIEVASEGSAPAGYADMVIRASIKTPLAGYFLLESKQSAHGKAFYPFLINIDGQNVLWQVEGKRHVLLKYVDGKTSRDPEAGEGMKYVLEKKVRLAAGSHRIIFRLPEDSYSTTTDIAVKSSGLYVLELRPVYRYKTLPTRIPTFLKGIKSYEIMFKEIQVQ